MVYAITYDLNKEGQDYSALYKRIGELGDAIHPLQNLWFLDSSYSVSYIREELLKVMDSNDSIFVTRMHRGEYSAWMQKTAHDWLDAKL